MTRPSGPLWRLTASDLAKAYQSGSATPVEATEACLARLDAVNPRLNAIVTVDRDGAMRAARASAERWRRGTPYGPLDGIPITVKDNLFVGGLRATWGSRLFAEHVAPMDDAPVARLREAGIVNLGKTNTPELALAGYTDNLLFGATGNPWAPELSPGGSSGGAAAAVMSGIAPLALVTDAGGSTRRPAGHVGAVGLKPSLGRVPRRHGFPALAADLQAIGQIGRTVADVRAMFECVALPALAASRASGRQPLRIAAFCRIGSAPVELEIEACWRDSLTLLSGLGHTVEPIAAPYDPDECGAVLLKLAAVGVARAICHLPDWRTHATRQIATLGDEGLKTSATDYLKTLDRVSEIRRQAADLFDQYDLIATPTAAGHLWPKAEPCVKEIAGEPAQSRASSIYTTWGNIAGLAGISLPAGQSSAGHPIGVQLLGRIGAEELLLDVAQAIEGHRPWPTLAPI